MGTPDGVFAVTTRSRLRGPWLFPAMLVASLRVRRQLGADSTAVRWATVIAGPTEFWTISVWRSRHDMDEFVRSGAHAEVMWFSAKWLRAFWVMRWRPGPAESGRWNGLALASTEDGAAQTVADPSRQEALEQALAYLPRLKAAVGPDGAARYTHTPLARRHRDRVSAARGVVIAIDTSWPRSLAAMGVARRLKREVQRDDSLLRVAVGVSGPGEVYLLSVWSDAAAALRLFDSPTLRAAARRFPHGCWVAEWIPESESGSWDGLRVGARFRHLSRRKLHQAVGQGRDRLDRG